MPSKKSDHHRAFDVFLPGQPMSKYIGGLKEIDTVFYSKNDNITEQEVRDSLVNHDGYDSRIIVKEVK
jgi:hypothetical protein